MWHRQLSILTLALAFLAACDDEGSSRLKFDGGGFGGDDANADAVIGFDAAVPRDSATGDAEPDDAAPGDAAPGDATGSCIPAASRCVSATDLEVCAADGTTLRQVVCPSGCSASACNPLNLMTGWTIHNWSFGGANGANYVFADKGLVATQTRNPDPSAYYNSTEFSNVVIQGRFTVQTTTDDDFVGFVFGWQDPQHFYLFDWKQARQMDNTTCGLAETGAALKVVQAAAPEVKCTDFWSSAGTDRTKVLVNTTKNPVGWKDNVAYDFQLTWKPGNISIQVREGQTLVVDIASSDATFDRGKFGFYNFSQQAVRYEGFKVAAAP